MRLGACQSHSEKGHCGLLRFVIRGLSGRLKIGVILLPPAAILRSE